MVNMIIFVFLGTVGWGISLSLIKILLNTLTPADIIFYRLCIGLISLLILSFFIGGKITNRKVLIKDGFVVGMFNMVLPYYFITIAQQAIPSSLSSVVNGLTPVFTCLIGVTLFTSYEIINGFVLASVLLGTTGIILINIDLLLTNQHMVYLLFLVLAGLSYGFVANYIKHRASEHDPIQLTAAATFFSVIVALIYKLLVESSWQWHSPATTSQYLALFWLGIISSGLCFYLYCLLIRRSGPIVASMITYLMTATGVMTGLLFLDERLTWIETGGCACIFASLTLINHPAYLFSKITEQFAKMKKIWPIPQAKKITYSKQLNDVTIE